jgi:putative hydrolase of HD superfamily
MDVKKDRLQRQLSFIIEIDKLKEILRRTYLMNGSRRENDAEHSWHIALMAVLLSEYAESEQITILRVVKMLLVHDLVEIYAGDTYAYDEEAYKDKVEREAAAAERIFSILPSDQAEELRSLWEEFEEHRSPDSRFATAMDVLQPLLHNYETKGLAWKHHGTVRSQVMRRLGLIQDGSLKLWGLAKRLVDDAVKKGYLTE